MADSVSKVYTGAVPGSFVNYGLAGSQFDFSIARFNFATGLDADVSRCHIPRSATKNAEPFVNSGRTCDGGPCASAVGGHRSAPR